MRLVTLPKIFLILFFLSGITLADEPLLILTEQHYPMSYTANGEDDEKILGFATELIVAVMEESGLSYELNMVPWARAMNSINKSSNVLVYSMSRSTAREENYHWIGEIWPAKIFLYGHRDRLGQLPLSRESIKKLWIGTPRGSVTREYLQDNGFENIVAVKTMADYIRLLDRDRIDLFPFMDFSVNMTARRQNFDPEKLVSVMELTDIPVYLSLAASKTMEKRTVKRLQEAFAKVKDSGRYNEIMAPLQEMINKFN